MFDERGDSHEVDAYKYISQVNFYSDDYMLISYDLKL